MRCRWKRIANDCARSITTKELPADTDYDYKCVILFVYSYQNNVNVSENVDGKIESVKIHDTVLKPRRSKFTYSFVLDISEKDSRYARRS